MMLPILQVRRSTTALRLLLTIQHWNTFDYEGNKFRFTHHHGLEQFDENE
jgi:hypothetical protein